MRRFNPNMLILAREARGYSQKELSILVNISQGTLSKIENGFLSADEYLNPLSKVLKFPTNFFYEEGVQFKANAHFYRKKLKIPKKEILTTEAIINIIKLNIEKLLLSIEVPDENLPKWNVNVDGSPLLYAKFIREYWRIPKGRINNLTEIIEDNGIIVMYIDTDSSSFDGLSLYTKNNQAIIFLNKKMSGDRLRLTLAHELGHLGMHFAQVIENDRDVEKEAFKFASELLVPSQEIMPYLSSLNLEKLANLKRYWKVSMASILFKSKELNLIKKNSYRYLWTQFRKFNYHIEEPKELEVKKEESFLIKEIIDAFINELDYSHSELSDLLSINEEDFSTIFLDKRNSLKIIKMN